MCKNITASEFFSPKLHSTSFEQPLGSLKIKFYLNLQVENNRRTHFSMSEYYTYTESSIESLFLLYNFKFSIIFISRKEHKTFLSYEFNGFIKNNIILKAFKNTEYN